MRESRTIRIVLGSMIALGLVASVAFTQDQPSILSGNADPPVAVGLPPSSIGGGDDSLAAGLMAIAMGVLFTMTLKGIAVKRTRDAEALRLEEWISEALRRDRALDCPPIIPIARVPIRRGKPAVIELYGGVPAPELRAPVMRVATQAVSRIRSDFQIHDRMIVMGSRGARAA